MELHLLRYFVTVAGELHFRRAAERLHIAQPEVSAEATRCLAALAYELLDAHADTAQLADGLQFDRSWAAHLDYLRALQRRGREILARATAEELFVVRDTRSDGKLGPPGARSGGPSPGR